MDIKEDQLRWFTRFFDKNSTVSSIKHEIKENQQLANKLHKPIITQFLKRKVYLSFKDNIWGIGLADMQLISKYNKGFRFFLFATDLFTKYAWVVPLKDKKELVLLMYFERFQTMHKENQITYGLMKVVNLKILSLKGF